MKYVHKILIVLIMVCIALVVLGIKWRSWDYNRIKNLDYRKNSRFIMRNEYSEPGRYLTRIKGMMTANEIHIINEYEKEKSIREIVGQSGRFWLLANYLNKVTIVDARTGPESGSEIPKREFLVFDGYIHTGSKAFMSIVLFALMAIMAISLKKKYMPHIFPEIREKQNAGEDNNGNDSLII